MASRPPITGIVANGGTKAGMTWLRPCPRDPCLCRQWSSAGSSSDSTLSRLLHTVAAGDSKELRLAALKVLGAVGAAGERNLVNTLLETDAGKHAAIKVKRL